MQHKNSESFIKDDPNLLSLEFGTRIFHQNCSFFIRNEASLLVLWCLLASIFDITEYFERQKLPDEDILPFVPHGNVQTYKKWNLMFTLPLIATFFAVLLLISRFFENTKAYQGLLAMLIMLVLEVYVAQLITYHIEMVANDTPELDFPDQGTIQTLVLYKYNFSIKF